MGRLTGPTRSCRGCAGSSTMNLSSGERPVCLPVRTTSGPSAAITPSPARMASSTSSAVGRLAQDPAADDRRRGTRRRRWSGGRRGGAAWRWPSASDSLRGTGDHVTDRPAARDAGPRAPQESASAVVLRSIRYHRRDVAAALRQGCDVAARRRCASRPTRSHRRVDASRPARSIRPQPKSTYQEWQRDRPVEATTTYRRDVGKVPIPGRSSCEIRDSPEPPRCDQGPARPAGPRAACPAHPETDP